MSNKPGPRNLITDVPGILFGEVQDDATDFHQDQCCHRIYHGACYRTRRV